MFAIKNKIQDLANQKQAELVDIRRYLHQHPELSFEETNTAKYLTEQLDKIGVSYQNNIGGNGIVVLIEGKNPTKKTIALRADIDALPIVEENEVDYCSVNKGVMHACGHDVHTTCLLGAIDILHQLKNDFEGTVKCIFQPAEEKLPGGASILIKAGVLENPTVENIVGQHVYPQLEVGKVAFRKGIAMASCDEIYITIKGEGGHGAMPQLTADTVLCASQLVVSLQQIVSRNNNPTMPTVLTIGKFIAEGATNIIPSEVKLEGTLRTFDEAWRAKAKERIVEITEAIVQSFGLVVEIDIQDGYPFLKNDDDLTELANQSAIEYLGEENVEELPVRMTAEDFAFYSQQVPACFYRLGTRNEVKGITSGIHTPTFDVDESCLSLGAGLMAYITMKQLYHIE
ncbi:MAG: amidohydrolase [Chitinophagales bacterium]|nr:amidohydrolase [Chitinophagales bacterium]